MTGKSPGRHRQNPASIRHVMGACDPALCSYCLGVELGLAVASRGSASPLGILAELMRAQLDAGGYLPAELVDALDELVPGWRAGCPAPVTAAEAPAAAAAWRAELAGTPGALGAVVELPAPRTGPAPGWAIDGDVGSYETHALWPDGREGLEWDRELEAEGQRGPVGGRTTFAQRFEHLTRQVWPPDVACESGGPAGDRRADRAGGMMYHATILDQAAADERVIVGLWSENNGREADRIEAIAARAREAQRRARELRAVR